MHGILIFKYKLERGEGYTKTYIVRIAVTSHIPITYKKHCNRNTRIQERPLLFSFTIDPARCVSKLWHFHKEILQIIIR